MIFFSIINNNSSDWLKPTRDIRKADPLSPYIFILSIGVLFGLISKIQEEAKIHGIEMAK